jgi:hypothetical protein
MADWLPHDRLDCSPPSARRAMAAYRDDPRWCTQNLQDAGHRGRQRRVALGLDACAMAGRAARRTGTDRGRWHQRQGLHRGLHRSHRRAAGWKVGAYTSPHLLRYNERVRIDGQDVEDAALVAGFNAVEAARGDTR